MCGICGVIGSQFPNENNINIMLQHINDRGPDSRGIYKSQHCTLAMTRLAIVDVNGGVQPMQSDDERYTIVFNGEIYNYTILREILIRKGYQFSTNSDTEVLLNMYIEFKEDIFKFLSGMFAFCIYDAKLNKTIIARDSFGIKPLYYTCDHGKIIFSSNLKSIKNIISTKINSDAIISFLGSGFIHGNLTPYTNIYKIPKSSYLVIDENQNTTLHNYSISINSNESLNNVLNNAIKEEIGSDITKKCILLSGGIDSTLICAIAKKELGINLHALIAKFENGHDESENAIKIANELGIKYTLVNISEYEALNTLKIIISKIDEPIIDTAIVPTYILSKVANEMGYKIIISGAGSDELFGGYSRHYPSYRGLVKYIPALPLFIIKIIPEFFNYIKHVLLMSHHRFLNFSQSISGVNFSFLMNVVNIEILRKILESTNQYYAKSYIKIHKNETLNLMNLDANTYLESNILALTDKISMMNSIECRVPFCNVNIKKSLNNYFAINNIDGDYKNAKNMLKIILSKYLNINLINKVKIGFNGPIQSWVMSSSQPLFTSIEIKSKTLKYLISQEKINKLFDHIKYKRKYSESLYMIWYLDQWLNYNE